MKVLIWGPFSDKVSQICYYGTYVGGRELHASAFETHFIIGRFLFALGLSRLKWIFSSHLLSLSFE